MGDAIVYTTYDDTLELKPGDVIVFNKNNIQTVHRIEKIKNPLFLVYLIKEVQRIGLDAKLVVVCWLSVPCCLTTAPFMNGWPVLPI